MDYDYVVATKMLFIKLHCNKSIMFWKANTRSYFTVEQIKYSLEIIRKIKDVEISKSNFEQ